VELGACHLIDHAGFRAPAAEFRFVRLQPLGLGFVLGGQFAQRVGRRPVEASRRHCPAKLSLFAMI
jgi:hypothetical protein